MSTVATHPGTVTHAQNGSVTVKIESLSACASCHAKCGFHESQEKELVVDTPDWKSYSEGDTVTVTVSENRGLLAVLLAYVAPSILLLVGLILFLQVVSELMAVLFTLALTALYFGVLYCFRNKLQSKFTSRIEK
ncbi:MAG: SoxR reducing system RseC family protein [Bacteroidales bacterium]|nr:SoxR reducing system RseC family protein [Bacteroidales bacterium]